MQAEEQEQFTIEEKATLFKELLEQRRKHIAAKRAEEKRNKPPTKIQQKKTMITYLKNMEGWKHKDLKSKDFDYIKELFDKAFKRVNMFVEFRTDLVEGSSKKAREELEQESTKKQKVDEDKDIAELQSLMEVILDEEEVAIDVVSLATKPPTIFDWKIHKEGKKSYYQIVRADGKSQIPLEDLDLVLWNDLKTMFKPHVEDEIWKLQQRYQVLSLKLFDSCGVHCLNLESGMIYMLVEKRYPLIPPAITNMLNKKLQTAGEVTTAGTKLLLLEEVTTASGRVNAASEEVSTAELVSTASEEVSTAKLLKKFDLLKWDQQQLWNISIGGDYRKKHPTNDIFDDGLNLHKYAYMALPDHVVDIIDGDAIVLQSTKANALKIEECLALPVKIGVSCSLDSPPQRMNIEKVVHELQL
ncbi:hypothetical protein Tco_0256675 [Tanacetum coccineum]